MHDIDITVNITNWIEELALELASKKSVGSCVDISRKPCLNQFKEIMET